MRILNAPPKNRVVIKEKRKGNNLLGADFQMPRSCRPLSNRRDGEVKEGAALGAQAQVNWSNRNRPAIAKVEPYCMAPGRIRQQERAGDRACRNTRRGA